MRFTKLCVDSCNCYNSKGNNYSVVELSRCACYGWKLSLQRTCTGGGLTLLWPPFASRAGLAELSRRVLVLGIGGGGAIEETV